MQAPDIQDSLVTAIRASLEGMGFPKEGAQELYLETPSDERFGELSSNVALRLAKQSGLPAGQAGKGSPRHLALSLCERLNETVAKSGLRDYIREIKVEGAGFINFYLSARYFHEQLKDIITKGIEGLKIELGKNQAVLIEFVSANPTGSLSVAHARQAAVGDILARMFSFCGFDVKREYYLNDEGNQINILGESVRLRMQELAGEKIDFPENYYQGEYIYDIAKAAGNARIAQAKLGDFAANYILEIIRQELDDFGVHFDSWFSQKELEKSGRVKKTLEFLKDKGHLYEQDGALWFKSTEFGDDKDRVVIKSEGSYTYLAPDIAYHEDKYKRGFKLLINLWGPDHHGYINRLKAAVAALGHDPRSLSIIIVQLATIYRQGKPVQMSTRKGQYITLREVLDEVGADAARFFFAMRRVSSHLDFDLEQAKKQTAENPVYYVQYAHARISSILRSAAFEPETLDLNLLRKEEEISLLRKLLGFKTMLCVCIKTQDPYMVTVYLQELSESFHKFYDRHRVLGQDTGLTQARLALIRATQIVIAAGLQILGVSRPEKM